MFCRTTVSALKVRSLTVTNNFLRYINRSSRNNQNGSKSTQNGRVTAGLLATALGFGGYFAGRHFSVEVKSRDLSLCEEAAAPENFETLEKGEDHRLHYRDGLRRKWKHLKSRRSHDYEDEKNEGLQNAIKESRDLSQRIKDEAGTPGLVISVSVDGKEIWSEGLGYADVENRVPCTGDTIMRIASISKPISMAIVAKLWESGQLDLDKPVNEYVESWPVKEFNKEKVSITTRHLVSHLGGIRHYDKSCKKSAASGKHGKDKKDTDKKKEQKSDMEGVDKKTDKLKQQAKDEFEKGEYHIRRHFKTVNDALKLFQDDVLCSKPGTDFLYTTHGWTLIAAVTEATSGHTFQVLMKGLFKDLDMSNTHMEENDPIIYNRARHYVKNERGRLKNAPYVDLSYKYAGGGLVSNVKDLNKFGNAMLYSYQYGAGQGGTDNTRGSSLPGYLKPETVKAMWTPVDKTVCSWDADGKYGMGWAVIPGIVRHGSARDQRFYVSHTGGAIGASSVLLVLPRKDSDKNAKESSLPQGVVVSMIVNMQSVGLNKTALEIAKKFEAAFSSTKK